VHANLFQSLLYDAEFDNAIFLRKRVFVYRNGECVEPCSLVQRFTADSVIIRCADGSRREVYHLRRLCRFQTLTR